MRRALKFIAVLPFAALLLAVSGQIGDIRQLGGYAFASLPTGSIYARSIAWDTTAGRLVVTNDGTTWTGAVGSDDRTFCLYNAGNLASATKFGQTKFIHAATIDTDATVTQDVVGVGAGNFVVKVCTDGATCAAGNTFATYTESCTAAAGTVTAATLQNAGAIAAGSTVSFSVATACATTDPGANICIHFTVP